MTDVHHEPTFGERLEQQAKRAGDDWLEASRKLEVAVANENRAREKRREAQVAHDEADRLWSQLKGASIVVRRQEIAAQQIKEAGF